MYFLWKRTPHGTIRISCEGLADFVQNFLNFLNTGPRLCGLALAPTANGNGSPEENDCKDNDSEGDAPVTLVLWSLDASQESRTGGQVAAFLRPMGLVPSIIWADRGSPGAEWAETRFTFLKNPWTWMAAASSIALTVIAGWAGFFWTAFWGTSAWFAARGILFLMRLSQNRPPRFMSLHPMPDSRAPDVK